MPVRTSILTCLGVLAAATPAAADDPAPPPPTGPPSAVVAVVPPPEPLPPPTANPAIAVPRVHVVEPAGAGATVGYGRSGMMEIGGSAGMMLSSQFRNVMLAPSFGWFFADNFELSGILSVSNVKAGESSATTVAVIAEPSYHVMFTPAAFGFVGMGVGGAYTGQLGAGIAVAPRIGANLRIGRAGVLTPSLQYQYVTHEQMTSSDATLVALTNAMSVNVGYTAMW